jgi:peptidoglycan hydrolase CwlO-like protein
MKLKYFFFLLLIPFLIFSTRLVRAEDECGSDVDCWNTKIDKYNDKLNQLSGEAQTLSTAIEYFDGQIGLAQAEINKTQAQLNQVEHEIGVLSGKITHLDTSLESLSELLLNRIGTTYRLQRADPIYLIFSSQGLGDYFTRYQHLIAVQSHDKEILITMEQTKRSYDQQKTTKEEKQAKIETLQNQLKQQRASLNLQKTAKQALLIDTRNNETKYQALLSDALAQKAAFSGYVYSQGGASILSDQTKCDDWGCYYNQRDSSWGNLRLGISTLSMAEYGCFATSVSMLASYYDRNIKPSDIANTASAFSVPSSDTALLKWNFSVNGVNVNITGTGSSTSALDSELAAGRPVIAGLYAAYQPHHFIVILEKNGQGYVMHDPFMENGNKRPLSDKYQSSDIKTLRLVSFN